MLIAIRTWVDARKRDRALRKLITNRRNDGAWSGLVPIGRDWFNFQSRTLLTGEGPRLVTSFYLVVEGDEAQAFREECRLGTYPRPESAETTSSWATKTERATIRAFMRVGEREVLPYRVFAIEGTPEDLDGSLRDAIEALQRELRRKPARLLREERMSPTPRREPAEDAEDMFRYPGWDGVEPLDDYFARDSEEAFAADGHDEDEQYDEEPPTLEEVCKHLRRCHKRYKQIDLGGQAIHWSVVWHEPDAHEDAEPVAIGRFGGRVADLPMPKVSYGPWDYPEAEFVGEDASLLLEVGTVVGMTESVMFDMTGWCPELG